MTEQTAITMAEFIAKHDLRIESAETGSNPNMDGMSKGSRHYGVTIMRGDGYGYSMEIFYSKGPALPHGVELAEVLSCLADDAAMVDNCGGFSGWCDELGFDSDSRKAEGIYGVCIEQAKLLREMIGNDAYNELLYDVERL